VGAAAGAGRLSRVTPGFSRAGSSLCMMRPDYAAPRGPANASRACFRPSSR
jgi:hypothetical protein